MKQSFKTRSVAPLAILIALLLASVTSAKADELSARPVKVIELQNDRHGAERIFFGRVTAKQTVDLAFQVGGQIVEFPAVEGTILEQGALLAALDPEPFEINVERATIAKDQADRALARVEQLQGTVTNVAIDDAATQAAMQDVALRDAEFALERAVLTTPFDALVASRNVANFTTIGAGTSVIRLHDMSELRIEISIPEILFQQIGDDPNVVLEAVFPASNERFGVAFREVNAEASQIGQTFQVTVGMTPPEGLLLLPGSSATVYARFPDFENGITIPSSAIYIDTDGSTFVMRLVGEVGNETIAKSPVDIRINDQGRVEVMSGLSKDDTIVAAGVQTLTDGQSVRRFTSL
jgi:RND family efflux transporter MFP subunit